MIDLESRFFERAHPDTEKMVDYGFRKTAEGYRYSVDILDREFRVELLVSFSGELQGKVIEAATGEVYQNIRIEGMTGAFVGKVREAYGQVLQAVRQNCYINDDFFTAQANRIAFLIREKYGIRPEFLWKSAPQHGVFRNQQNQKWFGIIMHVDQEKITIGKGMIDVLDIKVNPESRESLFTIDGIYLAYHLNKKYWISILLNERVSDEKIMQLIEASYRIVQGKGKKQRQDTEAKVRLQGSV